MTERVLWRKIARIVILLAEELEIEPKEALAIFYQSRTGGWLHDPSYGLHLESDRYIVNDIIEELRNRQ